MARVRYVREVPGYLNPTPTLTHPERVPGSGEQAPTLKQEPEIEHIKPPPATFSVHPPMISLCAGIQAPPGVRPFQRGTISIYIHWRISWLSSG